MKEITTGIVGAGRIGKLHADNLIAMQGFGSRLSPTPISTLMSGPGAESSRPSIPRM